MPVSNLSLTGKNSFNKSNLSGKCLYINQQNIQSDIKKIKILILNNLILPLLSKQWKTLHENLFCLDKVRKKIDYYYETYKLDELIIYKEFIKAFELIILQNEQLKNLEKNLYNGTEDVSTLIYKTTMIKIKPEYEIYDVILGKPNRKLNETYSEVIIKDIERLLSIENINFNKIKEIITNNYK